MERSKALRSIRDDLLEYEAFARDLETNEKSEASRCIREMMALMMESNGKLRKALDLLE
jgi:hypothetical protein